MELSDFDYQSEKILEARKVFHLIEDCLILNKISDQEALNAISYAIIILAASNKSPPVDVDKLLDFIKEKYREYATENGIK